MGLNRAAVPSETDEFFARQAAIALSGCWQQRVSLMIPGSSVMWLACMSAVLLSYTVQ